MRKRVAGVIIGDEILSGKTHDINTFMMSKLMFERGLDLKCVEIISDDKEDIAESLLRLKERNDYILTAGGIGPTHDDITYESVAHAFQMPLRHHDETLDRMRRLMKGELNESRKRMALFPAGAKVHFSRDENRWVPLVSVENVYIFPGIPALFESMLMEHQELFVASKPRARNILRTSLKEGDIATMLKEVASANQDCVTIGSYPDWRAGSEVSNKVTIEGDSEEDVRRVSKILMDSGSFR